MKGAVRLVKAIFMPSGRYWVTGRDRSLKISWLKIQAGMTATKMATKEYQSLFRRSSRCSRKVISSGDFWAFLILFFLFFLGDLFGDVLGEVLFQLVFDFLEFARLDLLFDLALDLIRGPAELPYSPPDRLAHLGQFFRAENEQGDGQDDKKLRETDINEHLV